MNKKSCLVSLVIFFVSFATSMAFAIPDVPTTPDHKAHWDGLQWESFNGNPSEATWVPWGSQNKNVFVMNNNEDDTRDKRVWIYMEKNGSPSVEINDSWAWDSDNNYDYTITEEFAGVHDPLNPDFNWSPNGNPGDWYLWYFVIEPQPFKEAFKFHVIGDTYDPGFVPNGDLWIFTSCPSGSEPVPEPLSIILLLSTLCGLFLKKRS